MSFRDIFSVNRLSWALAGFLFLPSVSVKAAGLDDFLPQNEEITGWTTYLWPRDANDLYWLIDGAGQVFIDHGFQEAVFGTYYDAGLYELDLEVFDLGTDIDAESTYHDPVLEFGWEVPRDDFGVEGRLDTLGLASYKAEFWRDKYFVRATVFQKNPYGLETLTSFCQLVDQKLMDRSAVDGLPDDGEIPGWNRYLLAADSLSLVSLLQDEADLFLHRGCLAALQQSYFDEGFVRLQLEVFDLGSALNAQSMYHDPSLETGLEVSRNDFGQEGRLDTTSSWIYSAAFWRQEYMARIAVEEKSDSALVDLLAFCHLVDQRISATAVEQASGTSSQMPARWGLEAAVPNPFNAQVLIRYRIPQKRAESDLLDISIYNTKGQRVRQLLTGARPFPGKHALRWDGRDERGIPVASGIYFCRLRYGPLIQAEKLALIR